MPEPARTPTLTSPHLPPTVQPVRVVVWVLHLAAPLAGVWLLLVHPSADLTWHDTGAHFWLVLLVAAINVVLGVWMGEAARGHGDARLFLVALAFLASAGFLLLHALATPAVLISHPNAGFDLATPVGLALAAVIALASSLNLDRLGPAAVRRLRRLASTVVVGALLAWALVSLLDLPPLHQATPATETGPLAALAVVSVLLYTVAAVRYFLLHRRRPAAVLVSVVTAFALLAEAMIAVTLSQKWHASWWEWHLLLTLAFGFVGYSAYVQYRREGSSAGLFDAVTLRATAELIRVEYGTALEELVTALHQREEQGGADGGTLAAQVAQRFGLTERQAAVFDRAGTALHAERGLSRRLGALVTIGEQARVGLGEQEFLRVATAAARAAYGQVAIGLVTGGTLAVEDRHYDVAALASGRPVARDGRLGYPLTVKGRVAGLLEATPPYGSPSPRDLALLAALANQLSTALENARLYRELDTLFHRYLSPDVAAALLADPDQAALGGSVVEVTALFADLRGFTTFSEGVEPTEIVRMLNRYHGVAVPCVLSNGGTIVQFVGDALLALFNAPARQADHADRAVRAALAMQRAVAAIAAGEPGWPRFRVGANTGPALVGNIGSETLRGFNAMGDAVNVAARLQGLAEPGQVVIGEATLRALSTPPPVTALGELTVKGRSAPVRAYVLVDPDSAGPGGSAAGVPRGGPG